MKTYKIDSTASKCIMDSFKNICYAVQIMTGCGYPYGGKCILGNDGDGKGDYFMLEDEFKLYLDFSSGKDGIGFLGTVNGTYLYHKKDTMALDLLKNSIETLGSVCSAYVSDIQNVDIIKVDTLSSKNDGLIIQNGGILEIVVGGLW